MFLPRFISFVERTEIIAAAQEERFTRKKFDKSFPIESILFCLDQAKVNLKDIDLIAFYEEPILKWDRIYNTNLIIQEN